MCASEGKSDSLRVKFRSSSDDPVKIAKALLEVARNAGAEDELRKSFEPTPYSEMLIPERSMRDLLDAMRKQYGQHTQILYTNISDWLNDKFGIQKADTIHPHLSVGDIEELRELVRAHFSFGIGDDVIVLFDRYGLTPADMGWMVSAYQEAFLLGRISPDIDLPMEVLRREMSQRPRSRLDEIATQQGEANLRQYLRSIGEAVSTDVTRLVSAHEARQISGVVNGYLSGILRQSEASELGLQGLSVSERAALDSDRWVTSERQLRSELYHNFKDDPKNRDRDWWRVSVTETRAANNIGRLVTVVEDGNGKIYFWVQMDACMECKKAYLNTDGTPKLFDANEIMERAITTSGVNIGKEARGRPNATLHPHCNCIPMTYFEGVELPIHPNPRGNPPRRKR